ncbi:helix-turn-helix transcriptional regulator [Gellertiella hungarica]|uniref:Putative transcriptional regulator YheO n=1 Tax=Gellertiella hungarica TaxID=1572859 RepID=A0A7W6J7Y8_9HYPH|nr:PAS domain-containing protein [Gellertiella hungarica]MBB4065541.1 putative transcriptional regulator YheO [Gellertiella hungarica]
MISKKLQSSLPVCDAIARLLHPHAEVVLHDLASERVVHIANALSPRRVGDPSLLEDMGDLAAAGDVIGPYEKTNPDGRRLRSISSIVRDGEGEAIGLLCINLDVEIFARMAGLLTAFLAVPAQGGRPEGLFAGDWREAVNETVGRFLADRNVALSGLDAAGEDALLARLDRDGIFGFRKAAPYVAEVFGWSRAKLYNRLSRVRMTQKGE